MQMPCDADADDAADDESPPAGASSSSLEIAPDEQIKMVSPDELEISSSELDDLEATARELADEADEVEARAETQPAASEDDIARLKRMFGGDLDAI